MGLVEVGRFWIGMISMLRSLVGHLPIEFTRLWFEDVPGEGVAEIVDAELFFGELEVFAPEAIVLGPLKLIDVEMREE